MSDKLLDQYVRARYPVIVIMSHEESRVMNTIRDLAGTGRNKRTVVEWSYTAGMTGMSGVSSDEYEDPSAALQFVARYDEDGDATPTLFVFKDLHDILKLDVKVKRFVRDIAVRFETRRHNLILLSPNMDIPADLEKQAVVIDWPLPDAEELGSILRTAEKDLPAGIPITIGENGKREAIVQAMRGLTEMEAKNSLKGGVVTTRELSESIIPFLVKEKAQVIRKSGVLEYYDQTVTMQEVGGLEGLKEYAQIKRAAFSTKAREAGVDSPKGLLMVGTPGTGKSLSAKAIAGGQMPLLRMDVGALMGGLVGQSEGNMRQALKVAEAVAPCVLWIDEIEKALGGMGGGETDGGTTTRVFGTLLTWMQETKAPVYVVATANDVRSLRPELLRRFDDVMFVDLPNAESRLEILNVHLGKRGKQVTGRLDDVVKATWSFSGAEIEKVVKSAIEKSFFEKRELTADDLLNAAKRIVPISTTMKQQIDELRSWATSRAIPAGDPLEPQPKVTSRKSQIEL
jgi:SpoVK/Ycf46/Vps4 family AAA+-type ATPase